MTAPRMTELRSGARSLTLIGVPVVVAFAVVGFIVLLGNSPLNYARHFRPPARLARSMDSSQFALASGSSGWTVVDSNRGGRLVATRFDNSGHRAGQTVIAHEGGSDGSAEVAGSRGAELAVWVRAAGQTRTGVQGRFLRGGHAADFWIVPPSRWVENPSVVPIGHGRFDVLYSWLRRGAFDVYLSTVSTSGAVIAQRRVARAAAYAFNPSGAMDSSGHIDVVYLDLCCLGDAWKVRLLRLSESGLPAGPTRSLGVLSWGSPVQLGLGHLDVKRGRAGDVWVAWQSTSALHVDHLSRSGRLLARASHDWAGLDLTSPSTSVVPEPHGAMVFLGASNPNNSFVEAVSLDKRGSVTGTERVEYEAGGLISHAHAALVGGQPAVMWKYVPDGTYHATLQWARHTGLASPDLPTRLGLAGGNRVMSAFVLLAGAVLAGIPLTVLSFVIVLFLIGMWVVLAYLHAERIEWALFLGVLAAVLTSVFAAHTFMTYGSFFLPPFPFPYGFLVVAGAVFVAAWVSRFALWNQEPFFRASLMVLMASYFVSVMSALIWFQHNLSLV